MKRDGTLLRGMLGAVLICVGAAAFGQAGTEAEARREMALQRQATAKSNEAEHQREMDELHLPETRRGVSGDGKGPNPVNYDESHAVVTDANILQPGTLPEVLRFDHGKAVRTRRDWQRRRAELLRSFDAVELGTTPASTPVVTWKLVTSREDTMGGVPVRVKQLSGVLEHRSDPTIPVRISLKLVTPMHAAGEGTKHAGGGVPVVMEFHWPAKTSSAPTKTDDGPSWQEQVLRRGWGYAEYQPYTVQPDSAAGLTAGVIGLVNHGRQRSTGDWGALKAWAWGASRCLDYLESDPDTDGKRVAIEGHSRFGKAALVAMAYDPRFAVAFLSSSGAGGAGLWRRNFGEQIENVESATEFHWMAGNFLKYAADPLHAKDLPLDQHELLALCAPRPVFVSGGSAGDQWQDSHGMFLAAVAASPVYALLGKKGVSDAKGPVTAFPAMGTPLMNGDLAFRQHAAGHVPGPNWSVFLDFAGRAFSRPGNGRSL